jgi:hypothetical protein
MAISLYSGMSLCTCRRRDGYIMIDTSRVNADFVQTGGSCVLSSYAVIANYFTSIQIPEFFCAYCKHFGIPFSSKAEAETNYERHFHDEWSNVRKCKGYEVILDLHENSTESLFVSSRGIFGAQFFLQAAPHIAMIENVLRQDEALLNITYCTSNNFHSVTVFSDGSEFYNRNTQVPGITRVSTAWAGLNNLQDGVLYRKL